jgi:hypothetical protein
MLTRSIEKKTKEYIQYQFRFRRRRNYRHNWDAENNIKRTLDTEEELCACFIDWQNID